MKIKLYTIAAFFLTTVIYSQDFDYLKKADTLYIKFRGKENEKKYIIETRITPSNYEEKVYNFTLENKNGLLHFEHSKYKNIEKKNANQVSEVRKVNKSFLKKNKKKIIDVYDLKEYKYDDIICQLFSPLKTFYIIDFTEKKKRNVTIYEVNCMNNCSINE